MLFIVLGNWSIGVGIADGGGSSFKNPAATFIPQPSVSYNIQPSTKFIVSTSAYDEGSIIDPKKAGKSITVDCAKNPLGIVSVIHNANGKLSIGSW